MQFTLNLKNNSRGIIPGIIFYIIIYLQVNVIHPASGACDKWKWSTISDEFGYSNNVWNISPPEPLCCGRTGIAGTYKFEKQLNEL